MELISYIDQTPWALKMLQSIIFALLVLLLRVTANFAVEKQVTASESKLRWRIGIRNGTFLLIVLGLLLIWSTELKTLALSLIAVAVALILATKELIMCLTGGLLKVSSGSFVAGDQIVVGEFRGEVIDQTLLSTTLLEIGPGKEMHQLTGRAITLPNSIFISTPVVNESYRQNYVLHGFSIPIKLEKNWQQNEQLLLEIANKVCEPYLKEAKAQLVTAAKARSVDAPSIAPRISISTQETEKVTLLVRVPTPVKARGKIEQEIKHRFLSQYLQNAV